MCCGVAFLNCRNYVVRSKVRLVVLDFLWSVVCCGVPRRRLVLVFAFVL